MIPTVIYDELATEDWANQVGAAINNALLGGSAILELATTPTGVTNELRWSTEHQAMMRWNADHQWVFAEGLPRYYINDDLWDSLGQSSKLQVAGGGYAQTNDAAPHFGIYRLSSVAVGNSGARIYGGGGATAGAGGTRFRGVVMLQHVGANSLHRVGFHDGATVTAPVDGAWLDIAAGVGSFKTSSASVATTHPTTVTLSVGIWYTIHVWFTVSGTSARCIVIDSSGTVLLDVSNTTNLPTGPNHFFAEMQSVYTTASAQTLMDVDSIAWGYQV